MFIISIVSTRHTYIHTYIYTYIGIISFVILIVLSVFFYEERVGFLDTSYHLFCIARDHAFAIQNYRFCAVFTQILPLSGVILGLPLKHIALLYSFSFVLLPFSAFLIIRYVMHNERVALIQALFSIMMVSHTFYWIMPELIQGVSFLLLWTASADNFIQKNAVIPITIKKYYSVLLIQIVLLITVAFSHPLAIISFGFIAVFLYLHYGSKSFSILLFNCIVFGTAYLIKLYFFANPYDSGTIAGFLNNVKLLFPDYLNRPANRLFIKYLITDYYFLVLLFIICNVFYLIKQGYMKLAQLNLYLFGFLCMIQITYFYCTQQFYLENQYLLLGLFVIIPFVYDVVPYSINSDKLRAFALRSFITIIFIAGLVRIYYRHHEYTARIDWYKDFLESLPHQKVIISEASLPQAMLKMNWGVPYESWFISTLTQGKTKLVLPVSSNTEYDWLSKTSDVFITPWGTTNLNVLDTHYFKTDTMSSYIKMYRE